MEHVCRRMRPSVGLRVVMLVALVGVACGQSIPGLEGPFVANVTDSSAVIWWGGPTAAAGRVDIGEWTARGEQAPYELLVPDLQPNTQYSYSLTLDSGVRLPAEGTYTFKTAPRPGGSDEFAFAILSDSRGSEPAEPVNAQALSALLGDAKARGARFVCFPGDMVFGYCRDEETYREQMRAWKAVAAPLMHEMPVYTTMGNHDVLVHLARDRFGEYDLDGVGQGGEELYGEEVFSSEFVNPPNGPKLPEKPGAPSYRETCFSFDFGNAHFVFLNTNYWAATRVYPYLPGDPCRLYEVGNPEGRVMERQINWLGSDLKRARAAASEHLFVFAHEPAFPVSHHIDDAMYYWGNATASLKQDVRRRRDRFWSLLSQYGVLAAFFGDEHNYSRSLIGASGSAEYDPAVWHVITGGAGAPPSAEFHPHVPWSDAVRAFHSRNHYCLVKVRGRRVALEVWALPEAEWPGDDDLQTELIDRVRDLTIRD